MFSKNDYFKEFVKELEDDIKVKISALRAPHDYFKGVSAKAALLPENILLFSRKKSLAEKKPSLHNRFVLICNMGGAGSVVIDGKVCRLHENEIVLILPRQIHMYADMLHEDFNWLFVTFEIADQRLLKEFGGVVREVSFLGKILFQFLLEAYQNLNVKSTSYDLRLILGLLLEISFKNQIEEVAHQTENAIVLNPISSNSLLYIQKAVTYIHEHTKQAFSIEDVARHIDLSASHLRKIFREEMSIGLGSYIRHARIQQACFLFSSTDLNVSQVATECGFSSLYVFSRTFKSETGLMPTEYKKQVGIN